MILLHRAPSEKKTHPRVSSLLCPSPPIGFLEERLPELCPRGPDKNQQDEEERGKWCYGGIESIDKGNGRTRGHGLLGEGFGKPNNSGF